MDGVKRFLSGCLNVRGLTIPEAIEFVKQECVEENCKGGEVDDRIQSEASCGKFDLLHSEILFI